jgi:hypothetical protein
MIRQAAEKGDRPVFAAGVDGLEPGLAQDLPDPTRWRDCPDGSLIFVDEAWKWFGHLSNAARQQTPQHVLDLAEHRHHGIDFVWTAQGPNQLYPFVRPLIEQHWHFVRKFGTQVVDIYKWGELVEEVKSQGMRDRAEKEIATLDKSVFGLYKSASQHTIKPRLPWKLWMIPVVVVLALVAIFVAYSHLKPDAFAAELNGTAAGGEAAAASPSLAYNATAAGKESPLTAAAWLERLEPRFPALHGSQPVFDGREAVAVPRTFCVMSGGDHGDESCTCYTEQVTKLMDVRQDTCRHVARYGQYDPFLAPPEAGQRGEELQSDWTAPVPAVAGTSTDPGSVGSPHQGRVQGRAPATLRASGG